MLTLLTQALVDGVLVGLVYAVVSVGLSLSMGMLDVINVSHSAFIMLGSFFALGMLTYLHLDPVVSFAAALPFFFAVGVVVHRTLVSRVERASQTIGMLILFGLMVVIETTGTLAWTTDTRVVTVRYSGLYLALGRLTIAEVRIIAAMLSLLVLAGLYAVMKLSIVGRAMQAMAQNRDAARVLGIDADRLSRLVFGLSIATAGAGGVAVAMLFPFAPQTQILWLAWAFLVVILGGPGRVEGTAAAGLLIGLLQSFAGALLPFNMVYLLLYLLLGAVLVVRGQGLGSIRRRTL